MPATLPYVSFYSLGPCESPWSQNMKRENQIISADGPESLLILKFNPETVKNDGEEGRTRKWGTKQTSPQTALRMEWRQ